MSVRMGSRRIKAAFAADIMGPADRHLFHLILQKIFKHLVSPYRRRRTLRPLDAWIVLCDYGNISV